MHPKKKYIVQLCEVSEEVLHKNKQEKDEIFKQVKGYFKMQIFL